MNLVFRPLVEYAIHTKRRCVDMANSIRGNGILRRVFDGFLIQVSRRGGTAIADVLDLPGDFFVAGLHTVADDGTLAFSCRPGYRLVSVAGEVCPGNMTWALLTSQTPMYANAFGVEWVGPKGYVSSIGKPWKAFGWNAMSSLPAGGRYLTYTNISRDTGSELAPFIDVHVLRIKPSPPVTDLPFDQTEVVGDSPTMASQWRVLHVPLSVTGVQEDHRFGEAASCSFYGDTGYLAYAGRPHRVVNAGYDDESPVLGVARIDVRGADGSSPAASVIAAPLAVLTVADLLPEDSPEDLHWVHPGPFDGTYTFLRLNGDFNPDFATSRALISTNPEPGYSYNRAAFAMFEGLQKTDVWPLRYPAYWAEQPASVAGDGWFDVLHTVVTERPVAMVSATFLYAPRDGSPAFDITMDIPEDWARYNHTVTQLVRFGSDGSKTVTPIYRSTYAVHDPALRNSKRGVYAPVLSTRIESSEGVEQSLFVCIRSVSSPGVLEFAPGAKAWWRGVAPQVNDVTLEIILGDGTNHSADLGDNYPVFYASNSSIPTPNLNAPAMYSKPGCVFGYGSDTSRYPSRNVVKPAPVCLYAPGMLAVVAAPKAGFVSAEQVARLVVIRISDGSLVAESEFELPFVANQLPDGTYDLTQWSVSCVEQGAIDSDGVLTRYAKLLLTEAVRGNPSVVYRADDLTTLRTIGVWGAPGSNYARGAVYYLGSSLAPAKAGRSGRSFISGTQVSW
ncbi:hypothetical protein [Aquipseudomonas campi]